VQSELLLKGSKRIPWELLPPLGFNAGDRPISVIPNLEDKIMAVLSPERNKPFKCKTILLFCPLAWELTERGQYPREKDREIKGYSFN